MPDSSQRGEKPSILVAEDEAALRTMLRYNQEKEGFCIETESGREALAKIAAAPPDLVILDWMLPVLSGIEVCRGVRRAPAIPGRADPDGQRPHGGAGRGARAGCRSR